MTNESAINLVQELLSIGGLSGQEGAIVALIREKLLDAGLAPSAIKTDQAHRKSPLGGEVGNLIVKIPGQGQFRRSPRRMFMAHLDTVPICAGAKPVRRGSRIVSADPKTGLGADNRAGVAVVLNTALTLLAQKIDHPPLTLLFPVQEEVGLIGARYVNLAMLGKPQMAFNFDGGSSAKLTIGATGAYRMEISVQGTASHAGVRPADGISAITIASLAIADLHRNGWLGKIKKRTPTPGSTPGNPPGSTTKNSTGSANRKSEIFGGSANVGVFEAGQATNVVTPWALIKAEARSDDPVFRKRILDEIIGAFEKAARQVHNIAQEHGRIDVQYHQDYESYKLSQTDPCVIAAAAAVQAVDGEVLYAHTTGGIDANWINAHDIPTVSLGAGQSNPHTTDEMLGLYDFQQACKIALHLATAS